MARMRRPLRIWNYRVYPWDPSLNHTSSCAQGISWRRNISSCDAILTSTKTAMQKWERLRCRSWGSVNRNGKCFCKTREGEALCRGADPLDSVRDRNGERKRARERERESKRNRKKKTSSSHRNQNSNSSQPLAGPMRYADSSNLAACLYYLIAAQARMCLASYISDWKSNLGQVDQLVLLRRSFAPSLESECRSNDVEIQKTIGGASL